MEPLISVYLKLKMLELDIFSPFVFVAPTLHYVFTCCLFKGSFTLPRENCTWESPEIIAVAWLCWIVTVYDSC